MKNNITTTQDLIKRLPEERQDKINIEVQKNIAKWGGVRENSGRKLITGKVLKFTKRLTEEEVKFIDYARKHNLDYNNLMQC